MTIFHNLYFPRAVPRSNSHRKANCRSQYFWIPSCCRLECQFYQSKYTKSDRVTHWCWQSCILRIFGWGRRTFTGRLTWNNPGILSRIIEKLWDWWVWRCCIGWSKSRRKCRPIWCNSARQKNCWSERSRTESPCGIHNSRIQHCWNCKVSQRPRCTEWSDWPSSQCCWSWWRANYHSSWWQYRRLCK